MQLKKYFEFLLEHPQHLPGNAIFEGGLAGHMNHVYDYRTPSEFLQFWRDFFNGKFDNITEKVDGNQIMWGFSTDGKEVVFARNASEAPFTDPAKKFPALHPAHESFVVGCNAIKKAVSKVSEDLLIKCHLKNEDGSGNGFVNTEVIYGEFPNLIQYSDAKHYIVFHNIHEGTKEKYTSMDLEDTKPLLTELAKACGSINFTIPVNTFEIEGTDISSVKRTIKKIKSIWEFHGPIYIKKEQITSQLEKLKSEFEDLPEVKALKDSKDLSQDVQFNLMKDISAKVGKKILINLDSALFSAKARKIEGDHPRIEGLVIPVGDSMVKITGSFREIKDVFWAPLEVDMPVIVDDFTNFLKNTLGIKSKNKSITPKDVAMMDDSLELSKEEKKSIKDYVNSHVLPALQKEVDKVASGTNVKKDNILNTFKLFAFRLKSLVSNLSSINNKKELMTSYISKE